MYAVSLIDPAKLRRMLLGLWVVIIALALAENLFLKPVFDQIRDVLYAGSGRFVYLAEDRDLQIYGQIRTTVFASEPSFLSDTLSSIIVMVFLLGRKAGDIRSWALLIAMVFISFSISPSFKISFYLIALFVWQLWPRNLRGAVLLLFLLAVLMVATWGAIDIARALLNDSTASHATTGSFFGRIGSAHLVGIDALSQFPILGFGIGNREDVYRIIVEVWHRTGAFSLFPWYSGFGAEHLLSNGFWWMWIYLGIAGGGIFLSLTVKALRGVGVTNPWRSMICASIVWYAGSAFIDPQSWYVVVVFSVGALSKSIPSSPAKSISV